jgi:hypothetical protein
MLGQEVSAWLAYAILFCFFSIALFLHSIYHWNIIPFTLYAICITSGSLFVILNPNFSDPDRPWRDQEPIINQLPVYSILIFAGIIDWQFVYIRFIETTIKNYKRWGSLHPIVISEKGDATSGSIKRDLSTGTTTYTEHSLDSLYSLSALTTKSSFLFGYWTFWIYISILILYAIVILAFIICKIAISDPNIESFASAIFITIMTFPSILNTMFVIYTGSKCHSELISRIMGQNGRETAILCLIPILFTIVMSSTTTIAWMGYTRPDPMIKPFDGNLTKWILAKSFSVYFPLTILLLCCLFKRREYTTIIENNYHTKSAKPPVESKGSTHHPIIFNNNKRVFVKP